MSFTYTQLKTAIEDYTENNETSFITNLPVFIRLTEERILKNVQLNLFRKNVSGTMTSSNKYLAAPSDFLAPFALSYTDGNSETVFIDFKDSEFVQSYNPNPATTGSPKYYGQYDLDNFILAPTPSSSFNSELHYFYRPLSLTQSSFTLTLTSVTGTFTASDTITGGTSGESSEVDSVPSSTSLIVVIPSGSYTVGETITASPSGATATISAIGADTTVTWLSENAEMAMLYGSLSEAYLYMKGDPQMMQLYTQRFGESVGRLKNLGEAQEPTDQYRSGQIIRTKT
tara:strand:+ start:3410 stop:4267 length:858 start_codon:yes stop_codon:yes gene_type:complete